MSSVYIYIYISESYSTTKYIPLFCISPFDTIHILLYALSSCFLGVMRRSGRCSWQYAALLMAVPFAANIVHDGLPTFAQLVERLAPAAVVVANHDARLVHKLVVVGKLFSREQAVETCAAAGPRPCMMIYSGDLTPMVHTFRTSFKLAGHLERREGRSVVEWCVHQAFYQSIDDSGRHVARCLIDAPVKMASKKTWDLYAVAIRLVPPLRVWHPKGISISWYAFDRGCRQALCRLLRRRHLLDLDNIEDRTERIMAGLCDWTLDSACCDHDVQNGQSKGCSAGAENYGS